MGGATTITGPEFTHGVDASALREGEPLLGHVGDEPVILVREGDELFATGAQCTHYSGPLAEGLVAGGTVRCPYHHASFDLRTGEALGPALAPLACYEVHREGTLVRVGKKRAPVAPKPVAAPSSVLLVGAGPAATACALALRREGYEGPLTLLGAERPGPVDRPNLSKDFLAGTAPEEWIPLRTEQALRDERITLSVDDEVRALDLAAKTVTLASGRVLPYGVLVLATGAEPVTLSIEGASLPHVHVLRTLADVNAILAALPAAKRAVVVGAGFIGLEAAASLRARGVEVTVVAPDAVPLGRVVGEAVGAYVRGIHEAHGTRFRLGTTPARITASAVELADGSVVEADLVIVGVGVRPRTALAERAGLTVDKGIVVDAQLRTSHADVYAIGDVARYPYEGALVRVEHFAVALRHGQRLAQVLAGRPSSTRDVPFFWSQHHEVSLNYVGHAERFDAPQVHGELASGDAAVVYRYEGRVRAVLTVGRDLLGLRVERAMEQGDEAALEALLAG